MGDAVLVQFGCGECAEMLRVTGPLHEAYAKRHGMEFHAATQRLCPARGAEWEKIVQLKARLMEFPLVIWLDADTYIARPEVDLRTAIPENKELAARKCFYHLLGPSVQKLGALYNTGVVIARNTRATRMFFDEMWAIGSLTCKPDDPGCAGCSEGEPCRRLDLYGRDWADASKALREEATFNWILQGNRGQTVPEGYAPAELPQIHDLESRFNSFTEYQVENAVVKAWHGIPRTTALRRMIEEAA